MTDSDGKPLATGADPLRRRYRRLLSLYPERHRALHEEEMLGVLLDDSPPGRTRPDLAATADLVTGAAKVRLVGPGGMFAGDAWRRAATLVGPAVAIFMIARAIPSVYVLIGSGSSALGSDQLAVPAVFGVLWAFVLVLSLTGRRRVAAVMAGALTLGLAGYAITDYVVEGGFMVVMGAPLLVFDLAGALTLLVRPSEHSVRPRSALPAAAMVGAAALGWRVVPPSPIGALLDVPPRAGSLVGTALVIMAVGALAVVLRRVGTAALVRMAAILAPALATGLFLYANILGVRGLLGEGSYQFGTPTVGQCALYLAVPVLGFGMAVFLVAGGERLVGRGRSDGSDQRTVAEIADRV